MEGMSERNYSTSSWFSRGATQIARKAGRPVVLGDGSINATASDARRSDIPDPDQQRRSTGGDSGFSWPAESFSCLKARTAPTVYQAQERDVWVTWPARMAALTAVQVAAEVEKQWGKPVMIEAVILQRVLESHARATRRSRQPSCSGPIDAIFCTTPTFHVAGCP